MTTKYWKSPKQQSIVDERRRQLDSLFECANADLAKISSHESKHQIIDFLNLIKPAYAAPINNLYNPENVVLIQAMQKHLRSRLKKIIHGTKLLVEMPLWKVGGHMELTVEAKLNQFNERFRFRQLKTENLLKTIKLLADLLLIEIIKDLDLKPVLFRNCPRCGNFFYQPTARVKNYCSIRCGDAVRLQRLRKKKKMDMHKKSDESILH